MKTFLLSFRDIKGTVFYRCFKNSNSIWYSFWQPIRPKADAYSSDEIKDLLISVIDALEPGETLQVEREK
jgi:hypothetical protein